MTSEESVKSCLLLTGGVRCLAFCLIHFGRSSLMALSGGKAVMGCSRACGDRGLAVERGVLPQEY